MALTLTEIIQIYHGNPKPEQTSLRDLVSIAGHRHYSWFEANEKPTDEDTLARSYADKMKAITRQFVQQNETTAKNTTLALIVSAGNVINYSDVLNYNTSDWEAMLENNIVTALEVSGGITSAEKIAYDGL
jgi:NADP-dependent 3-hydroxy acid dehydrogenase YdfG